MKTLVFDTETTGFPITSIPLSDSVQPHLIQIAALLTEGDEILTSYCTIIHCPIEPSEGAFKVHGISKARSMEEGVTLCAALASFNDLLSQADRLVAHNMQFDLTMMKIAYFRGATCVNSRVFENIPKACTMKTAAPIMQRLGKRHTLDSCYRHFHDPAGFSNAHDAGADTMACFQVLCSMEKKDIEVVTL